MFFARNCWSLTIYNNASWEFSICVYDIHISLVTDFNKCVCDIGAISKNRVMEWVLIYVVFIHTDYL